jgi:hypothetical protein
MSRLDSRLMEIALRKERLVSRGAAQRNVLQDAFRRLERPAGIVDRGLGVARFLSAHPVMAAVAVAGFVALRRRGILALAGSLFSAWRLWKTVSASPWGPSR